MHSLCNSVTCTLRLCLITLMVTQLRGETVKEVRQRQGVLCTVKRQEARSVLTVLIHDRSVCLSCEAYWHLRSSILSTWQWSEMWLSRGASSSRRHWTWLFALSLLRPTDKCGRYWKLLLVRRRLRSVSAHLNSCYPTNWTFFFNFS